MLILTKSPISAETQFHSSTSEKIMEATETKMKAMIQKLLKANDTEYLYKNINNHVILSNKLIKLMINLYFYTHLLHGSLLR